MYVGTKDDLGALELLDCNRITKKRVRDYSNIDRWTKLEYV